MEQQMVSLQSIDTEEKFLNTKSCFTIGEI